MKKKNLGFTLIELIVSITVVSVLSGIGLTAYTSFNRRQILNSAIRMFVDDLKLAQSRSVSGEKPSDCQQEFLLSYQVTVNESESSYYVTANCSSLAPIPLKTVNFPPVFKKVGGFNWVKFKALRLGVEFDPPDQNSIVLTAFGLKKSVVVGKAGEIYSYEPEE